MGEKDNAYPVEHGWPMHSGLTKLEYFTAAALSGLASTMTPAEPKHVARYAVALARAALEAAGEAKR